MPRKKKPEVTVLGRGLSARTIAIDGLEQAADWLDFRDRIIRSLAPEGDLEIELALTVAEGLWRRRRIARYEQHVVQIERQRDGAKEAWRKHREQKVGPDATATAAPQARIPRSPRVPLESSGRRLVLRRRARQHVH